MATPSRADRDRADDQSVRCLQLVDHTYRNGVASLGELAALAGTDPATIAADVALLKRGGLRIDIDKAGRCRIVQPVPGFALRLTRNEAAVAWAKCRYCTGCSLSAVRRVPTETVRAACALLEAGLRKHHPDSEGQHHLSPICLDVSARPFPVRNDEQVSTGLSGEAARVFKRLRIFDLVESGKAHNRDELTAVLGISERTAGHDLRVMRRARLQIAFRRDLRSYEVTGLHAHLAESLTASGGTSLAAAIMLLFQATGGPDSGSEVGPWCKSTCRKIRRSIRLIFKDRENELDAALDACKVSI